MNLVTILHYSIHDAMINKASQVVYLNNDYSDIYYDAMGGKFYEEEISTSNTTGKHYAGPIVFSESNYNLTSIYIDLGEGMFWKDGEYYVKFRDYQNSTRVVVRPPAKLFIYDDGLLELYADPETDILNKIYDHNRLEIVEVNNYDPWGVEFGRANDPYGIQANKHQDKERLNYNGLNFQDHGARLAFNVFSRWMAMDPLMEDYYDQSPYHIVVITPFELLTLPEHPNGKLIRRVMG